MAEVWWPGRSGGQHAFHFALGTAALAVLWVVVLLRSEPDLTLAFLVALTWCSTFALVSLWWYVSFPSRVDISVQGVTLVSTRKVTKIPWTSFNGEVVATFRDWISVGYRGIGGRKRWFKVSVEQARALVHAREPKFWTIDARSRERLGLEAPP